MKAILLMLLALLCLGCQPIVKENSTSITALKGSKQIIYEHSNYPLTISSPNSKREIESRTYLQPPQRVVAVWQNSIETLLALGVGDRIVAGIGVPDKKYFRPEYQEAYSKIPYTSLENLDLETIMTLQPDMIVGWTSTFSNKVLRGTDFWHSRGVNTYIPVSALKGKTNRVLEDEYQDILNLGDIFDRREKAQSIIQNMQREIDFVTNKTGGIKKKARGLIVEIIGKEIRVYGSKSLAGDILKRMNGELLAPENTAVSKEQIIDLNPDALFIIVIESGYGREADFAKFITEDKALRHLSCVQNGRVYTIPLYAVYYSGVRTYDGIKIMARGLYPDLYKE